MSFSQKIKTDSYSKISCLLGEQNRDTNKAKIFKGETMNMPRPAGESYENSPANTYDLSSKNCSYSSELSKAS